MRLRIGIGMARMSTLCHKRSSHASYMIYVNALVLPERRPRHQPKEWRLRRNRSSGSAFWKKRQDLMYSFFFSPAQLNRVTAVNRRILGDHRAEEARDARSNKRSHGKTEHRGAKLSMISEVATILDENERDHGDRDRREPGDVLLPLHPQRVPADGGGTRHQQPLRKHRKVDCSRRGCRAVPRVDDVSSDQHSGPCKHNHRDQVKLQEALLARCEFGWSRCGGEAIQLHQRTGACQQIECTKSHAVYQRPKSAYRNFHLLSPLADQP